jgi:uncharacterized protein (DUF433 family)
MTTTFATKPKIIYAGRDPGEIPSYALKEASQYLQIPLGTMRTWVLGRKHTTDEGEKSPPLVKIADPKTPSLSFRDLVELHVLSAIRREHPIHVVAIRKALHFLRRMFHTNYALSSQEMRTGGKELFIERYGKLANISEQGLTALKDILDLYLHRIERNRAGLPIRLYPFTRADILHDPPGIVAIDPQMQFGRPCIVGTRITTEIIMERYLAGESVQDLADDYDCSVEAVEEAIRFETAF